MCVFLSLALQFRSRRSSARCVWRQRCVTASVLTPLCTHTLAWQPDTHSWSRMEPVYVLIPQKHTHHVTLFVEISDLYKLSDRLLSLSSVFWPHVHPVGMLPRREGSDDITLATKTHVPGAASAQRRYVQANVLMLSEAL